jgi:DNA-binding transcriptional ArsR family regulator
MSRNDDPGTAPREREMDLESLKALAHPLRVKIFDVLSTYGSFTASGLAERLGESSGATSYHLRQLEKHGFVREVAGKGVGRERWWERTPGGISLGTEEASRTSAGREASQLVMREWSSNRERTLAEFLDRGLDVLSKDWVEASTVSLTNVFVTAEELGEFTRRFMEMASDFADLHRNQKTPGSRPVQIQFHAFPVIDGEEIPQNDAPEGDLRS